MHRGVLFFKLSRQFFIIKSDFSTIYQNMFNWSSESIFCLSTICWSKHFYQTCSAFDHNPAFLWFIPHFFWGSSNPHEFKDPQILKILGSLKRKRKERGLSLSLPCCPSISSHILSLSPFPRKPLPSFPQYVLPWSLNPQ